MNKRVNYMELLKESVADRGHDTTKSVDVKGPFLDPILGYDGGGELPTHKDASSILERYYFNQDSDKGVSVSEDVVEEEAAIPQVGDDKGALKDVPEDVDKSKADAAKATELKEEDELLEDDVENAVIERLIAEMEEDIDLLEEDEILEEAEEEEEVADDSKEEKVEENSPPQDPASANHEPSGDPKKDKAGLVDGDDHKGGENVVKPATFPAGSEGVGKGIKAAMKEGEEVPGGEETPKDEVPKDEVPKKDIDVDKEVGVKESGAPVGNPATADENEPYENLDEQFEIFKEAIEDDDDDDDDDKDDKKPTFEKGKAPNFGKDDVKV